MDAPHSPHRQPWKELITMTCPTCGRAVPLLPVEDARLCPYCGQGKIARPDQNAPGTLPTSRPEQQTGPARPEKKVDHGR